MNSTMKVGIGLIAFGWWMLTLGISFQQNRIEQKVDRLLKVAEQYEPGEKESLAKPVGREVAKCH